MNVGKVHGEILGHAHLLLYAVATYSSLPSLLLLAKKKKKEGVPDSGFFLLLKVQNSTHTQ